MTPEFDERFWATEFFGKIVRFVPFSETRAEKLFFKEHLGTMPTKPCFGIFRFDGPEACTAN